MKDYHECEKLYIGDSDYAALTLTGIDPETDMLTAKILNFNEDAGYRAWLIVDDEAELDIRPKHYVLKHTFTHWVKIYDDTELVKTIDADRIEFYRAGDRSAAIKVYGLKGIR